MPAAWNRSIEQPRSSSIVSDSTISANRHEDKSTPFKLARKKLVPAKRTSSNATRLRRASAMSACEQSVARAAKSSTVPSDAPAPADDAGGVKHPFLYGLFTNLANPKALVYFGSIFSTFVTPDVDASARLLLFVTMTVEAFLWFAAVALLFGSGPLREGYRRIARAIDAVTGVLFAGFGIGLVVSVLRNEA